MGKKLIAVFTAVTLVFIAVFAACDRSNTYTDPSTGKKYLLVTDKNGEAVRSSDGELLVYATNQNGKVVTDAKGNASTENHGFVGQYVKNGVVKDYAYTIKLPKGWRKGDKVGQYIQNNTNAMVEVSIIEEAFDDYYNESVKLCKAYQEQAAQNKKGSVSMKEITYDKADSKAYKFYADDGSGSDTSMTCALFFEAKGNVYDIVYQTSPKYYSESDFETFYSAIDYLNYVYYPNVTSKSTTASSSKTVVTTAKSAKK